ncbi:DUF4190 domain-containing protein [Actinomycetospora sp. C-140]
MSSPWEPPRDPQYPQPYGSTEGPGGGLTPYSDPYGPSPYGAPYQQPYGAPYEQAYGSGPSSPMPYSGSPAAPGPYGAYGYQPGPPASGLAIAALVCGILGFFTAGITSIPAVICGHLAWPDTSNGHYTGHGMTIAGLVLGYIPIVGWIVFWLFIVVLGAASV